MIYFLGLKNEFESATVNEPSVFVHCSFTIFQCLCDRETVIIIDDAHNIDTASWEYMCELCTNREVLIVLGLRPTIIEQPSCKEAFQFMEDNEVRQIDLGSLDLRFMSPLACQMMDVVSLPKDLDK